VGNVPDLVLLESNPFDNITAVRGIKAVFLNGRVLDASGGEPQQ